MPRIRWRDFCKHRDKDYIYRAYAIAATAAARMGDTEVALGGAEKASEGVATNIGYVHGHIAPGLLWYWCCFRPDRDG